MRLNSFYPVLLTDDVAASAAFFSQVEYKNGPQNFAQYNKEETVYLDPDAELRQPRTGVVMQPKPGRIYDELPLALARPRDKTSPAFEASTRRVLAALDQSLKDGGQPRHRERAQEAAALWW